MADNVVISTGHDCGAFVHSSLSEAGGHTLLTEDRPLRACFERLLALLALSAQERAFVRAALEGEEGRALWLVVADWLEEHGRGEEGERMRRLAKGGGE